MTRINVVQVETLSRQHLISEFRELPRAFALAHKASINDKPWTNKQPNAYTMGTGHVMFFYDKLGFLADRHKLLILEMQHRGYKPALTGCLREQWQGSIPQGYWKGWEAGMEAIQVNQARIDDRNAGKSFVK